MAGSTTNGGKDDMGRASVLKIGAPLAAEVARQVVRFGGGSSCGKARYCGSVGRIETIALIRAAALVGCGRIGIGPEQARRPVPGVGTSLDAGSDAASAPDLCINGVQDGGEQGTDCGGVRGGVLQRLRLRRQDRDEVALEGSACHGGKAFMSVASCHCWAVVLLLLAGCAADHGRSASSRDAALSDAASSDATLSDAATGDSGRLLPRDDAGVGGCRSDLDCTEGSEWCVGGECVPCNNDGRLCPLACAIGWEPYVRNGCQPCECVPTNECERDSDCTSSGGTARTCYAGARCPDWCPANDPSCCQGNLCDATGCSAPHPVGCLARGCAEGLFCREDVGCVSSGCGCTDSGWACDADCGGGTCVEP